MWYVWITFKKRKKKSKSQCELIVYILQKTALTHIIQLNSWMQTASSRNSLCSPGSHQICRVTVSLQRLGSGTMFRVVFLHSSSWWPRWETWPLTPVWQEAGKPVRLHPAARSRKAAFYNLNSYIFHILRMRSTRKFLAWG